MAEWRWEYDPTADHVIGGIDGLAFTATICVHVLQRTVSPY
ncbi:hypothetical protein [Streptomyces sp. NPDC059788]